MKFRAWTVAALCALAQAAAWAQKKDDHSAHHTGAGAQTPPMAEGEVRKVDAAGRRITLKHGQIPSIDMPPMTMVFAVKDPALLKDLKVGEKVKFQAEMIGGAATVTQIQRGK